MTKQKPKGMLGRRNRLSGGSVTQVDMFQYGLIGGGLLVGLISYPERKEAVGVVLLPSGATAAAIGLVLLLHTTLLPGR